MKGGRKSGVERDRNRERMSEQKRVILIRKIHKQVVQKNKQTKRKTQKRKKERK